MLFAIIKCSNLAAMAQYHESLVPKGVGGDRARDAQYFGPLLDPLDVAWTALDDGARRNMDALVRLMLLFLKSCWHPSGQALEPAQPWLVCRLSSLADQSLITLQSAPELRRRLR